MTAERSAEFRVYRTDNALNALLEKTGGEVTPEVEALEDELAKDQDSLAEIAVGMVKDADAEMAKATAERARLGKVTKYQERRKARGRHLLRRVAEERGVKSYAVGAFKVRLQPPGARVVEDGSAFDEEDLVFCGLARFEYKPDRKAILAELKKGAEVPGWALEYPTERTVVVT